jgi:SH3 domain protein
MAARWWWLIWLVLGATAVAQTRYVSDRTIVELRRGPSTEYLILRNLQAGEEVQVLEQNADAGYSRVRVVDGGAEGWILTRFLTAEPIARDRLAAAERNLATARERVGALEAEVGTLTRDLAGARTDLEQARAAHGTASKELTDIRSAAANVVQLREENESVQQRLVQRDREVEELRAENSRLAGRDNQNWFLIGAGVLFGGMILGLVLPSLRRKRRSDW